MLGLPQRYEDLGPLGQGGMGEIRRVRDRLLDRVLAIKLMRIDLGDDPEWHAQFIAEVKETAQLQHPGIIPVHDLGTLPDGRLWYTMKLSQELRPLHSQTTCQTAIRASGGSTRVDILRSVPPAGHRTARARHPRSRRSRARSTTVTCATRRLS